MALRLNCIHPLTGAAFVRTFGTETAGGTNTKNIDTIDEHSHDTKDRCGVFLQIRDIVIDLQFLTDWNWYCGLARMEGDLVRQGKLAGLRRIRPARIGVRRTTEGGDVGELSVVRNGWQFVGAFHRALGLSLQRAA